MVMGEIERETQVVVIGAGPGAMQPRFVPPTWAAR